MNVQRGSRLRDIANAGEDARRALERAGLDYCCEGSRTLGEACAAAGVEVELLEAELRRVDCAAPQDWSPSGISAVLDCVLAVCHPRTKRLLADARSVVASLAVREPRARILAEALDALDEVVSKQMCEEEECLFARVRALAEARMGRGPYPPPPFRTIHEHGDRLREGHKHTHARIRRVSEYLAQLGGAADADVVRERVQAALSALTEQMHFENNELIPRASDLEPNGYAAHA